MTELLQQAIAQVQKLPREVQDAIASRLLAELEDEQKWETRLAATSDEQWEKMAAKVKQEIASGETDSIELADTIEPLNGRRGRGLLFFRLNQEIQCNRNIS
jgi:hypothetical protein